MTSPWKSFCFSLDNHSHMASNSCLEEKCSRFCDQRAYFARIPRLFREKWCILTNFHQLGSPCWSPRQTNSSQTARVLARTKDTRSSDFLKRQTFVWEFQWQVQGRPPPRLFLDQPEGQRAEKKIFLRPTPPPPGSEWPGPSPLIHDNLGTVRPGGPQGETGDRVIHRGLTHDF